jgi:ankyrin repeat protein
MHRTIRSFLSLFFSITIISWTGCDAQPPAYNINTFSGSYKSLAQAIKEENIVEIARQIKVNNLDVNFKDGTHGISLLKWSIYNERYSSCKALLELGANPNQVDSSKGKVPPITMAANVQQTSEYLKLLLKFGGNPNIITKGETQYTEATPLCAAAASRLESVQLLVANGADVNLSPYPEILPLTTALITQQIGIAKYLIVEKKADVNKVYTVRVNHDTARIADLLRLNIFPLESEEYKSKMEVVNHLKSLGIDYKSAPIPKYLSKNYPKEFLDKY